MRHLNVFTPKHIRADLLNDPCAVLDMLRDRLLDWSGKRYCVLCSSGTAALYMAMRISKICNAYLPASTFPAVREAYQLHAGFDPQYLDCDLKTWFSKPAQEIEFVPVHNYGCLSPYYYRARVVDAAAAILTQGAFLYGSIFCVSFNWNKSVSGGGGGAILTDIEEVAERAEGLKRHVGHGAFNFQMPALCAAEVYDQMETCISRQKHLEELTAAYDEALDKVGLTAHPRAGYGCGCRWLTGTMFGTKEYRDEMKLELEKAGYMCREPWLPLCSREVAPNAWEIHERGLILPGGYSITQEDAFKVAEIVSGLGKEL